jgi:hypothetical protein
MSNAILIEGLIGTVLLGVFGESLSNPSSYRSDAVSPQKCPAAYAVATWATARWYAIAACSSRSRAAM